MLFSAVKKTHCALVVCDWMGDCSVVAQCISNVHWSGNSTVWLLHGWCHLKLLLCQCSMYTIKPCTSLQCHFIWGHTCGITLGWNGYWNKSQYRQLTLEKKILLLGLESITFQTSLALYHYSVQFKMVCIVCTEKPMCVPPCLSQRFPPTSPLKQFQCLSAPTHPVKEDRLALPLSMPLSSRRSMVWCPWLCACG